VDQTVQQTDFDQFRIVVPVLNEAAGNFDVAETIRELEEEMLTAANHLEFEKAALLRDQVGLLDEEIQKVVSRNPMRVLGREMAR